MSYITRVYTVVIVGTTKDEHDQNLDRVLKAIKMVGLKLNKEKCMFRQTEIGFLGHTISNEVVKISIEKVDAIQNSPNLQTFKNFDAF